MEIRADVLCFTASSLIKEAKAAAISKVGKRVADIGGNQDILVSAFAAKVGEERARLVILDGHFALRDAAGKINNLAPGLFAALGAKVLACVVDDAAEIRGRLLVRDGEADAEGPIRNLQSAELNNARQVSATLSLPLFEVRSGDLDALLKVADLTRNLATHIG